jgi:hypothetical protein
MAAEPTVFDMEDGKTKEVKRQESLIDANVGNKLI